MDISLSRRHWDRPANVSAAQHASQTLPSISALTSSLSDEKRDLVDRDSGTWSLPQSTRSSTYSTATTNTTKSYPYSSPKHLSVGGQSLPDSINISGPANSSQLLPAINHGTGPDSASLAESRRSSVDSRMNHGFGSLALNSSTSPYHSTNASQASILSSRAREPPTTAGHSNHASVHSSLSHTSHNSHLSHGSHASYASHASHASHLSRPLSPLNPSNAGSQPPSRTAPAISSNPRSEIYNAEAPTRGLPYAFPDPGVASEPTGPSPSQPSRRPSVSSFGSSIYDRGLPQGQLELPLNHHHPMQHKQVRHLIGEPPSPNANSPYSRTPELRVSHKLAERKRRSEMKDCFESLRLRLPSGQTNKSSKWETLTRSIEYIDSLESVLKEFRDKQNRMQLQIEQLHAKLEQHQISPPPIADSKPITSSFGAVSSLSAAAASGPAYTSPLQPPPVNNISQYADSARTLPPLLNSSSAPTPMQGIQYDDRY